MIIFYVIATVIFLIALMITTSRKEKKDNYLTVNKGERRKNVNMEALPLVKDNNKYIELQTKEWIRQRKEKGYCYGLFEKDKIVMVKWMQKFDIRAPKIHYYNYHSHFTFDDFKDVVERNGGKRLVVKISHLQSNYGIFILPAKARGDEYLRKMYNKFVDKFKTCFVCNHDKDTAPTVKEIERREKGSHYELYETIEPGIIIQDYFETVQTSKLRAPKEFKILVYGDRIIDGVKDDNLERHKPVYDMARKISNLLGASLIRVDMFVKDEDNPYIPYLNEISLSPNGGLKKNVALLSEEDPTDPEVNELLLAPMRSIPIEKYLTDADWGVWRKEKYRFGVLK